MTDLPRDVDPIELRSLAEDIAGEVGDHLAASLEGDGPRVTTKTSVTDLVTDLDRWSEARITERLLAARPDDSIRGEEGADVVGSSGIEWVVDPIDGTVNFVHGMPGFNVSIAARVGTRTIAGAVYSPLHGDMFTASLGGGATLGGEPIRCSSASTLPTAIVGTGFSYDADERRRQALVVADLIGEIADIRRVGAGALDLCWVACGRFDGFWEIGLNPWDYAAGGLIAEEAGAAVEIDDPDDGPSFTVAAAPGIRDDLVALLDRVGARLR